MEKDINYICKVIFFTKIILEYLEETEKDHQ